MVPVEYTTPGAIFATQKKGIKMVALTARPASIRDMTVNELKMAGIDLSLTAPKGNFQLNKKPNDSGYYNGIIFADLNNDKGVILNEFLTRAGLDPKKVVFLDDIKQNAITVDEALASKGIECLCVRYGGADAVVKKFDPKIADVQLKNIEQNLSDDDAKKLAKKKR